MKVLLKKKNALFRAFIKHFIVIVRKLERASGQLFVIDNQYGCLGIDHCTFAVVCLVPWPR